MRATIAVWLLCVAVCLTSTAAVRAQSYGIELHNSLMPAAGAMGGVSIALPQDVTSAINGNPATVTQFDGTQVLFGGAWAEPTFKLTQTSQLPILVPNPRIEPYSATSSAPGTPVGNIGVTQSLEAQGLPVTIGLGFVTTAGGLVDFRHVPESNGTNSAIVIFSLPVAVGIELTEHLSIGAGVAMGIAFFDGPFVGAGGMNANYALRGTLGANYELPMETNVGAYYQTRQAFQFDNAVVLNPGPDQVALDANMDLPQNFGLGIANRSLAGGNLLLAADLIYKCWEDAALFKAIYNDQWVAQFGAQYTQGRCRLRGGYAWGQNPINPSPGSDFGGITQPGALPVARYTQGLLAVTSEHRISFGIGLADLLPGIDMDLMAGGMFEDTEQLGLFTTTSIESYWIAVGLTWRFGSCHDACDTADCDTCAGW